MPFIGIHISGLDSAESDALVVRYRHKDYGSGSLSFDARTLGLMEKPVLATHGLPRAFRTIESGFPGMEIRRADDQGNCGSPGVRYLLQWETLAANHDLARQHPLPAPSTLRLHKLVERARADIPSK